MKVKNRKGLVFIGCGFELLGVTIGAFYVGQRVDDYMGSQPLFLLLFLAAGFFGWVFHLYILLRKFMRETEQEQRSEQSKS